MQGSTMTIKATLYSVHNGIIKKYHGTINIPPWSTNKALFKSDTKTVYRVNCSIKPGVVFGRTIWFEEDTSENAERVIDAF